MKCYLSEIQIHKFIKPLKFAPETSEPVNIAGSFATNCEVVSGLAESLVNSFFTCSTTSSCLTAPEAEMT